jgi:hypothetical protein
MQPNVLQKLYPHLRFNQITPQVRSASLPPKPSIELPSVEEITQKPVEPIQKNEKTPTEEVIVKESIVSETIKKEDKKPKEKTKKVKVKSPVKSESPKPQPDPQPVRESQIPIKGEKGLQRKYTSEQRKDMYLNSLSRKSVKKAELEVTKVNQVLESVENSPSKLALAEKELKKSLKLINTAKLFIDRSNINDNVTSIPRKENETGSMPSPCSEKTLPKEASETSDESESD